MKISVEAVSKRFLQHYIFKNVSLRFETGQSYALLGINGSGKSTLLRIIAGMQSSSKGNIEYSDRNEKIPPEHIFQHVSFSAPSMDLIEEMTLQEILEFHFSFKPILKGFSVEKIIEIIGLSTAKNKYLNEYSSGMRQRVKLAQAIFTDSPVLLLDEPCTNLDQTGVEQYRNWIKEFSKNKLLIIASNEEREYDFCQHQIHMEAYK